VSADIAIIGIGETEPTRRSSKSIGELTVEAIDLALADAGITADQIDGIVTEGQIMPSTVTADWVAGRLGTELNWSETISAAGAGTVAAAASARARLNGGEARYVLCYFGVDWGTRPGGPYGYHDIYPAKVAFEAPYGFNAQPLYFAMIASRYRARYGLRAEQLGAIAVNARANSIATGRGQKMKPLSMDDYLGSPLIADPLRYADCCLISDGAAAYVMTTADRAVDAPKAPVYVRGVSMVAEGCDSADVFTQKDDLLTLPSVAAARLEVEKQAGLSLSDIDFAELYDCFTISCLMQIEDLGFCEKGEAGDFVLEGNIARGGRLPVNTHGGLLAYSYLLAAEHVNEAVRQLRGEAGAVQLDEPRLGIVTGLTSPDYGLLLLGR
jgi:acetyl-CoA acetyltransferase